MNLSPATQKVLNSAQEKWNNDLPCNYEYIALPIVAALRSLVEQNEFADVAVGKEVSVVRVDYILNIANELELKNYNV
jgi:hypothetical protein